jgi:hypothetical protein
MRTGQLNNLLRHMPVPAYGIMAASTHVNSCLHLVLIRLLFLASAAVCDISWLPVISRDPVVGFDIGLTHVFVQFTRG